MDRAGAYVREPVAAHLGARNPKTALVGPEGFFVFLGGTKNEKTKKNKKK